MPVGIQLIADPLPAAAMADHEVEMDEGDDIYEPEEPKAEVKPDGKTDAKDDKKAASKSDELEEGEEEDEGDAMDEEEDDSVSIVTVGPPGLGLR